VKLRSLTALAIVVVIGAGCGSKAPAETDTDTGANTKTKTVTAQDKAVMFAQCMRDNDVSEFPDPDASGELTIDGVLNGSSLDPDGPAWKKAIAACKDLQPPGFTGKGKRSDEQQNGALKFAQCIREHGVEDFPDPAKGQPLVDTNRIPSAATSSGMTILNAAMKTCGKFIQDQLGRR
jgi:hypothetical protein